MIPFEEFIDKEEVEPHEWHQIDQNLAQARELVAHLTNLQVEHINENHVFADTCQTPCTSTSVINHISAIDGDAAKLILHMIICDAAQALVRRG